MTIQKALVVDDSRLARIALSKLLDPHNIIVVMAGSSEEALQCAKEQDPDIIFMDYMMPDVDGYETTRILNNDPKLSHIPVVMCTSQDTEEDRQKARECGAKGFLTKPTTQPVLDKVITAINKLSDKTRGQSAVSVEKAAAEISATKTPTPLQATSGTTSSSIDKGMVEKIAQNCAKDVISNYAEEAIVNKAEMTAHKAIEECVEKIENDVISLTEKSATAAAEAIAEQTADKIARQVTREVLDEVAASTIHKLSESVEKSMAESLNSELSKCLTEFLEGDDLIAKIRTTAQPEAETVADGIARKISRQTAESTAEAVAEQAGSKAAAATAKSVADNTARETAEYMFDQQYKKIKRKILFTSLGFSILAIAASVAIGYFLPQLV
ncbi:MAG: response regulator [Gammaproteobacteria bacterium]|nr:MAG: response regulator [Gammaproteobacteria bacterium]